MDLKIKSVTGSINATSYNGKLHLDLVSGNITIEEYTTDLNLKTISSNSFKTVCQLLKGDS